MYHFPSSTGTTPKSKSDPRVANASSLNATQSKSESNPLFLKIEEELHDARRVREHGQEDDMRLALDMVIGRVTELTTTLSEAYRTQAELEVQLNVAKSNLQLVIMNNEMLEEALKKDHGPSGARDLGWRRGSANSTIAPDPRRANLERSQSVDYNPPPDTPTSAAAEKGFFKFARFSSSSATAPNSRPGTPSNSSNLATAPQILPPSPLPGGSEGELAQLRETLDQVKKDLEAAKAEAEKERVAKKKIGEEKVALEDELESLSQALFEEANKMVAEERIKLHETAEELKETRAEKEALQSALRLLNEQHQQHHLHSASQPQLLAHEAPDFPPRSSSLPTPHLEPRSRSHSYSQHDDDGDSDFSLVDHYGSSHSRSSSRDGIKSVPTTPPSTSRPLVNSTTNAPPPIWGAAGDRNLLIADNGPADADDSENQPTPRYPLQQMQASASLPALSSTSGTYELEKTSTAESGGGGLLGPSSRQSVVDMRDISAMLERDGFGGSMWADAPSSGSTPSSTVASPSKGGGDKKSKAKVEEATVDSGGRGGVYDAYAAMR